PPDVPAPPETAVPLRVTIGRPVVRGALTASDVERAIGRTAPALARCKPAFAEQVDVSFTIDERRRATAVTATGASPATNACVAAALGTARTHEAPDVGDAKVAVRIGFVVAR
nr:hypothetical protein [Myxococcota bacterium]